MFGRKKSSDETLDASAPAEEAGAPAKSASRPAASAPLRPPLLPPRPLGDAARPMSEGARPMSEGARRFDGAAAGGGLPPRRAAEMRKLIVGREISLAGEITSCDRLVVEGSVEANLANCRDIEISETGVFKGSASIEDAEIRGRFEGVLNVRRRLLIRATGRIVGTVRYGQIEIECGGQISGDIQAQPTMNEPPAIEVRPVAVLAGGDGRSD